MWIYLRPPQLLHLHHKLNPRGLLSGNPTQARSTRRPLSPIRKRIAQRLVEAQQTAAILSTFNEVDLSAVMALRKAHQDAFVKGNGDQTRLYVIFCKSSCSCTQGCTGG